MLNFRNTNIVFILLLLIAVVCDFRCGLPWYAYLIMFIAYSLLLFYGSYFVSSGFFIKVICAANTSNKEIALSFDDGPSSSYTPKILDVLNDHDVKAAFFCIGSRIAGNEAVLKRVHDDGHVIGNHSYSHHFWFDLFSSTKMLHDLEAMDRALAAVTGLTPRLFRPPYGVTNPNLKKAILKGNYIPVGWNIRSMDTVIHDRTKLLKRVTSALQPGAIVLFHDTSKTTLSILPSFIKHANEQGYSIVRLDKLLNLKAYA